MLREVEARLLIPSYDLASAVAVDRAQGGLADRDRRRGRGDRGADRRLPVATVDGDVPCMRAHRAAYARDVECRGLSQYRERGPAGSRPVVV
jgi:hypothetical protein